MTGIEFVTDDKGREVAVQIDLKKYGAWLEDLGALCVDLAKEGADALKDCPWLGIK